ncbi:MAG: hypothetical protein KDD70_15740 [Bdellovibrionales bacterium]|nr:hypothetical protein [Bdellovibrionales bacterium]
MEKRERLQQIDIALVGALLVTALPLILYGRRFLRLFWFADEIALLHEWNEIGFSKWAFASFAENVIPVYKAIWGGAVLLSGGDYDLMILTLWITHFGIIGLFYQLLRQHSLDRLSSFLASATVGIAWGNIHLLTISYHLNAGLAALFALAALVIATNSKDRLYGLLVFFIYTVLLAISVLSFSRGIAYAASFFCYWILRAWLSKREKTGKYLIFGVLSCIPIVIALTLLLTNTDSANKMHAGLEKNLYQQFQYAYTFFAINPWHHVLQLAGDTWNSPSTLIVFFIVKIVVYGTAIALVPRERSGLFALFVMFLAFDLLHSLMLGYGRAAEGLETTIVPRYQRSSLLALAPALAFAFVTLTERFVRGGEVKTATRSVIITLWLTLLLIPWFVKLKHKVK